MQVEMYFHAIYHLTLMSEAARKYGLLSLESYGLENEVNPLIQESVALLSEAPIQTEHITLYLKNKGENEYMFTDENYIECIVTGIKCINDGCSPRVLNLLLSSYLPKTISSEVTEKIKKAFEADI